MTSKSDTKKAVALNYSENLNAPEVVATGRGIVAEKILEMAVAHGVPVKEDPVLVDALSQLDLGQEIPPELYTVVAEILIFIMKMDKGAK